jgi:hypothetical protein
MPARVSGTIACERYGGVAWVRNRTHHGPARVQTRAFRGRRFQKKTRLTTRNTETGGAGRKIPSAGRVRAAGAGAVVRREGASRVRAPSASLFSARPSRRGVPSRARVCVIPGRRVVRWPHAPAWRRKYLPGRIETNDEFSPQKSPRFKLSPPPLASRRKPFFSRMGLWANRAEGS